MDALAAAFMAGDDDAAQYSWEVRAGHLYISVHMLGVACDARVHDRIQHAWRRL